MSLSAFEIEKLRTILGYFDNPEKLAESDIILEINKKLDGVTGGYQGKILKTETPADNGFYSPLDGIIHPNFGNLEFDPSTTIAEGGDKGALVFFIKKDAEYSKIRIDLNAIPATVISENNTDFVNSNLAWIEQQRVNSVLDLKSSKSSLFSQTNQLFDKTEVINGFYVSNTTGLLVANATSSSSPVIPVTGGALYSISGKTTTRAEITFIDGSGTRLKPENENGTTRTLYDMASVNGVTKAPATAVSMQFTVKFAGDGGIPDDIMVNIGTISLPYEDFGYTDFLKQSIIPTSTEETNKLFKIEVLDGDVSFRTKFDETYDIFVNFGKSTTQNNLFNINDAKLLEVDNFDAVKQLNGYGNDGAAPTKFNNYFLGGNHGAPSRVIVSNSHGKTLADVGAVYRDNNSNDYVIVEIVDSNTIKIVPNLVSGNSYSTNDPVTPLVYQSNGDSTSNIVISSFTKPDLFPVVINVTQTIELDGVGITANGTYFGDKLSIIENYSIIDFIQMVNNLISNRPVGGYLTQPNLLDADAIIRITSNNKIHKYGNITIASSFRNPKTINMSDYFGIAQTQLVVPTWATTFKRYFPKVLPITNNGNTYDFRIAPNFTSPVISGTMNFTSGFWENGKATSRVVDILQSATFNVNYNLGYLPIGTPREDLVNNAWYMTSSKKLYPRFLDSKLNVANVLPTNTVVSGVAFIAWSKPAGLATNNTLIENGGKQYLFLDYHQTGIDTISLPNELIGKTITVIDKSANVNLKSNIVTEDVIIEITTASPLYGYAELLIE
tara:strand:+ start:22256 stop:24598 length:2343 start_codon:yes stop_codon:yes gene_type:complete